MKPVPLEDSWVDVLRKARKGRAIPEGELMAASGLSAPRFRALNEGKLHRGDLGRLAEVLGLDPISLVDLAEGKYHPGEIRLPEGMAMFTTPWDGFEVHSYLLWDPGMGCSEGIPAAAFDTGSDVSGMLDFMRIRRLSLGRVFLTHAHGDHLFDLERLLERTGAHPLIGDGEELAGVEHFAAGAVFSVGSLSVETRSTRGHARGGMTYVVRGLERPVAIVGDALFAGSMGGAMVSYEDCLETAVREIFSLPGETILCPGHGPLTTVALERHHNPFFSKRLDERPGVRRA